jgi:glyoxylate utilization-related uncharacterized protein
MALHRHKHAEVYYILDGGGTMQVGSNVYEVRKGDVVYVPGGEEHGIWNGRGNGNGGIEDDGGPENELKFLYVFAADGFGQVKYRFS